MLHSLQRLHAATLRAEDTGVGHLVCCPVTEAWFARVHGGGGGGGGGDDDRCPSRARQEGTACSLLDGADIVSAYDECVAAARAAACSANGDDDKGSKGAPSPTTVVGRVLRLAQAAVLGDEDAFPGPMCSPLRRVHAAQLRRAAYVVTEKSDGLRVVLVSVCAAAFPAWCCTTTTTMMTRTANNTTATAAAPAVCDDVCVDATRTCTRTRRTDSRCCCDTSPPSMTHLRDVLALERAACASLAAGGAAVPLRLGAAGRVYTLQVQPHDCHHDDNGAGDDDDDDTRAQRQDKQQAPPPPPQKQQQQQLQSELPHGSSPASSPVAWQARLQWRRVRCCACGDKACAADTRAHTPECGGAVNSATVAAGDVVDDDVVTVVVQRRLQRRHLSYCIDRTLDAAYLLLEDERVCLTPYAHVVLDGELLLAHNDVVRTDGAVASLSSPPCCFAIGFFDVFAYAPHVCHGDGDDNNNSSGSGGSSGGGVTGVDEELCAGAQRANDASRAVHLTRVRMCDRYRVLQHLLAPYTADAYRHAATTSPVSASSACACVRHGGGGDSSGDDDEDGDGGGGGGVVACEVRWYVKELWPLSQMHACLRHIHRHTTNAASPRATYWYCGPCGRTRNDGLIFTPDVFDICSGASRDQVKWKWPALLSVDWLVTAIDDDAVRRAADVRAVTPPPPPRTPSSSPPPLLAQHKETSTSGGDDGDGASGDGGHGARAYVVSMHVLKYNYNHRADTEGHWRLQHPVTLLNPHALRLPCDGAGVVVECVYDAARALWRMERVRHDRRKANSVTTVISVFQSLAEGVTLRALLRLLALVSSPTPARRPAHRDAHTSCCHGRHCDTAAIATEASDVTCSSRNSSNDNGDGGCCCCCGRADDTVTSDAADATLDELTRLVDALEPVATTEDGGIVNSVSTTTADTTSTNTSIGNNNNSTATTVATTVPMTTTATMHDASLTAASCALGQLPDNRCSRSRHAAPSPRHGMHVAVESAMMCPVAKLILRAVRVHDGAPRLYLSWCTNHTNRAVRHSIPCVLCQVHECAGLGCADVYTAMLQEKEEERQQQQQQQGEQQRTRQCSSLLESYLYIRLANAGGSYAWSDFVVDVVYDGAAGVWHVVKCHAHANKDDANFDRVLAHLSWLLRAGGGDAALRRLPLTAYDPPITTAPPFTAPTAAAAVPLAAATAVVGADGLCDGAPETASTTPRTSMSTARARGVWRALRSVVRATLIQLAVTRLTHAATTAAAHAGAANATGAITAGRSSVADETKAAADGDMRRHDSAHASDAPAPPLFAITANTATAAAATAPRPVHGWRILDVCCRRGADLATWKELRPSFVCCTDASLACVADAAGRYSCTEGMSVKTPPGRVYAGFRAHFAVRNVFDADDAARWLTEVRVAALTARTEDGRSHVHAVGYRPDTTSTSRVQHQHNKHTRTNNRSSDSSARSKSSTQSKSTARHDHGVRVATHATPPRTRATTCARTMAGGGAAAPLFDLASCQFALHRSCASATHAEVFVRTLAQTLRRGGLLVGTTVHDEVLLSRVVSALRNRTADNRKSDNADNGDSATSGAVTLGNDLYHLHVPPVSVARIVSAAVAATTTATTTTATDAAHSVLEYGVSYDLVDTSSNNNTPHQRPANDDDDYHAMRSSPPSSLPATTTAATTTMCASSAMREYVLPWHRFVRVCASHGLALVYESGLLDFYAMHGGTTAARAVAAKAAMHGKRPRDTPTPPPRADDGGCTDVAGNVLTSEVRDVAALYRVFMFEKTS